jgi:tetratricopeptide (TPR) repeat protein
VLANLKQLSKSDDRAVAAAACRQLGWWYLGLSAVERAEPWARRAVALQPTFQENWDLLLACKWTRFEPWEAYQVCKKQLRHLPTPMNYLRFAEIHAVVGLHDQAAGVLRSALKRHPDDVACRVGLAAMLLLQDDQPATLAKVKQCLDRARELAGRQGDRKLLTAVRFHEAIYLLLTDRVEESRQVFQDVYAADSADEWATRALAHFWDSDQNARAVQGGDLSSLVGQALDPGGDEQR